MEDGFLHGIAQSVVRVHAACPPQLGRTCEHGPLVLRQRNLMRARRQRFRDHPRRGESCDHANGPAVEEPEDEHVLPRERAFGPVAIYVRNIGFREVKHAGDVGHGERLRPVSQERRENICIPLAVRLGHACHLSESRCTRLQQVVL